MKLFTISVLLISITVSGPAPIAAEPLDRSDIIKRATRDMQRRIDKQNKRMRHRADTTSLSLSTKNIPSPATKEPPTTGTAAIIISNTPLARVVQQIQDQSKTTITLHGINPQMKVSLIEPKPIPVETLLNRLTENVINIIVKKTGESYELWDKNTYTEEHKTIVTYTLAEATADNAQDMLINLIPREKADIIRDDRLNKLYINALPETQTEIASLLKQIDQKLFTRIFTLDNTQPQQLQAQLATFLGISAKQIIADTRTNQLALTGTLAQLQRAEGLVTAFDIPTTTTQR